MPKTGFLVTWLICYMYILPFISEPYYTFHRGYFWMGLSDRATEGAFRWQSGSPVTFSDWAPTEPNSYHGIFLGETKRNPTKPLQPQPIDCKLCFHFAKKLIYKKQMWSDIKHTKNTKFASTYAKVYGSVSVDALQKIEAEESACGKMHDPAFKNYWNLFSGKITM